MLYREDPPGRALNFVWASEAETGAHWDSPFEASSKMIVQATGPSGDWREEEVDVSAWYRTLFGGSPPPLLGVALMSDSDNSCRSATAYFASFRFRSRPGRNRRAARASNAPVSRAELGEGGERHRGEAVPP